MARLIHLLCHATQHPQRSPRTYSAMTERRRALIKIIQRFAMEPDNCGLAVKIDLQENSPTSTCHCSWLLWAGRVVAHYHQVVDEMLEKSIASCVYVDWSILWPLATAAWRWPAHRQPRRQAPSPVSCYRSPIWYVQYHCQVIISVRDKIQYLSHCLWRVVLLFSPRSL
jgi:hypothetical protein